MHKSPPTGTPRRAKPALSVVEWAEAKHKSSTYSVSAGQNSTLELSTHLPNERHSEPRPIHTVLVKCAFSPNQQGISCILLNSLEPRVT